MTPVLWLAIALIGAATLIARLLPLLWPGQAEDQARSPAWLDALGPCLLTAMGVAVLLPEGIEALTTGQLLAFLGGVAAAAAAMAWRRDPGLAAIAGVAGWWLASGI